MDSTLWVLLFSSKGASVLSEEYEGDLYTRSTLIYIIFGALVYVFYIGDLTQTLGGGLNTLLLFLTPIAFLFYGYLISKTLYYWGKMFGSKAAYYQVYTIQSYAMIPLLLGFMALVILQKSNLFDPPINTLFNRNVILIFAAFVSLKIGVVTTWKLGKMYLVFAPLAVIPMVIVPLVLAVKVFGLFEWPEELTISENFFDYGLLLFDYAKLWFQQIA